MTSGESQNYFELFDLPIGFHVDTAALAERYRALQRATHPDRYVSGSPMERQLAVQHAARVNEAYRTLRDPVKRARYLLGLHGYDDKAAGHTHTDPEFLADQMVLRERLAEIDRSATQLRDLRIDVEARMRALSSQLEAALGRANPGPDLEAGALAVARMQFFSRLHEEILAQEDELAGC